MSHNPQKDWSQTKCSSYPPAEAAAAIRLQIYIQELIQKPQFKYINDSKKKNMHIKQAELAVCYRTGNLLQELTSIFFCGVPGQQLVNVWLFSSGRALRTSLICN